MSTGPANVTDVWVCRMKGGDALFQCTASESHQVVFSQLLRLLRNSAGNVLFVAADSSDHSFSPTYYCTSEFKKKNINRRNVNEALKVLVSNPKKLKAVSAR
jgi:hypothetical protein